MMGRHAGEEETETGNMTGNAIQDAAWGYNGPSSGGSDEFVEVPGNAPDTNLRDGDQLGVADTLGNVKALDPQQGNREDRGQSREIGEAEAIKIRAANAQLAQENARLREDQSALNAYLRQTQQQQQQTLGLLQQQLAAQTPAQQAETRQRIVDMIEDQGLEVNPEVKTLLNAIDSVSESRYGQMAEQNRQLQERLGHLEQHVARTAQSSHTATLEQQWNGIVKQYGEPVARQYSTRVADMIKAFPGMDVNQAWGAVAQDAIANRAIQQSRAQNERAKAAPLSFLHGNSSGGGQLNPPAYRPDETMEESMAKFMQGRL